MTILSVLLVVSKFAYGSDHSLFEIKAGVISINGSGKPVVVNETTTVPLKVGLMFGAIVTSSPRIEFDCMITAKDPSETATVNSSKLGTHMNSIDTINAKSVVDNGVSIVSTNTEVCKGNLYAVFMLNESDKPGERAVTLTINNKKYPEIIFNVVEE